VKRPPGQTVLLSPGPQTGSGPPPPQRRSPAR
jgi:hypothetical protein